MVTFVFGCCFWVYVCIVRDVLVCFVGTVTRRTRTEVAEGGTEGGAWGGA